MLASVTGLASRASFVDACCVTVGAWASMFAGVIVAAAASAVNFRKERRL
jgi:hypothetical protein